jgi:serine/threonine protein kinase
MSVEVSLVDFGSSFVESSGNRKLMYVQSRMYRSPEILMTLDYDHKIDIWNLAVTLVELLKGVPMFLGRHGRDHMQLIAEILGVPPEDMVRACKESKHSVSDYFFDENDNLRDIYQANENTGASDQVSADGPAKVGLSLQREGWFGSREIEKDAEVAMKAARCLQALKEKPRRVYGSRPLSKVIGDSSEDGKLFTQFISEMLQWDPRARAEPEALLEHPFLQCGMSRSSSHLSLSSCASLNPSNPSRSLFSAGSSKGSRKSRQGEETAAPSLPPASHAGASYGNSTKDRRH